MNVELLQKAQYLEQRSKEAEATLQFINEQASELENFKNALEDFGKIDEKKEKQVLAQIGNKVYAKTELKDKELFVDVGVGVIVKKSPSQTKETVETQLQTLNQAKTQVTAQLEEYTKALLNLMAEIQKEQQKSQKPKKK